VRDRTLALLALCATPQGLAAVNRLYREKYGCAMPGLEPYRPDPKDRPVIGHRDLYDRVKGDV
jgi:hypothetical protein